MTFTDAATMELRDRIRSRLNTAARFFRGELSQGDDFLEAIVTDYDSDQKRNQCAFLLETAANWMDESAIYTIHAWANKMLQQHAFDSGSLFHQTLNNNDGELLSETVRDFWREYFYNLNECQAKIINKHIGTPDDLLKSIQKLLTEDSLEFDNSQTLATLLDEFEHWEIKLSSLASDAKNQWIALHANFETLVSKAIDKKWLKGNIYQKDSFPKKVKMMESWLESGKLPDAKELAFFGPKKLENSVSKAGAAQTKTLMQATTSKIDELVVHLNREENVKSLIELQAIQWVRDRYTQMKLRQAQMTYDDMLNRLDAALQSSRGSRLEDAIREQFPMALIDEFQDTDPVQYRIFSKIYLRDKVDQLGCFLIGDPKQAIYSFRRADIFTYLKAHKDTQGHHYTLEKNYRSTVELVHAVNYVFLQRDNQTEGKGAFRFKSDKENPIPFLEVSAQGREDEWVIDGETPKPLTFWCLNSNSAVPVKQYHQELAETTASQIVELLNNHSDNTGFKRSETDIKPLMPGDIAILVRTGREAKLIRRALFARNLPSVYLSERESVFETDEAHDLLLWIKAMANPREESKVRAAISTKILGFSINYLQYLLAHEESWELHLNRFIGYQKIWASDGILPAIRLLIYDYKLSVQKNTHNEMERSLTNLLHLAELLHQTSMLVEGEQALIRSLSEAIAENVKQTADDNILRLESDANLIKIVTIHKSKGLEYPLVFLPFIASYRDPSGDFYKYHDEKGHLVIDLKKSETGKKSSQEERLQEDLRLLYVAMTRAKYACWLGLASIKVNKSYALHNSAIGYLAGFSGESKDAVLKDQLQAIYGGCRFIDIKTLPEPTREGYQANATSSGLEDVAKSNVEVSDNWWIASYSALKTREKAIKAEDIEPAETAMDDKADDEIEDTNETDSKNQEGIHALPRGAGPGILVHTLLETCGKKGFASVAADDNLQVALINSIFGHKHWEDKHPLLKLALDRWLKVALFKESAFSLSTLKKGQYQVELEFLMGVDEEYGVNVLTIDNLIKKYTFQGLDRPEAKPNTLKGLFKGFIDLVFSHEDKYYVADYKFNSLGDTLEAYSEVSLKAAMLSKRYDLQMVLYLLSLHRLLKSRIADYDYDKHVGGGVYWFLRGSEHTSTHGLVFERPPKKLIVALEALFMGASR